MPLPPHKNLATLAGGIASSSSSPRPPPDIKKDVSNRPRAEPLDLNLSSGSLPADTAPEEVDHISKRLSELQEELFESLKEDIADWIMKTLGDVDINAENFVYALDTGTILCRMASAIEKRAKEMNAMGTLTEPLPNYKLHCNRNARSGTWFARDNTTNFLGWCRAYGMIDETLFDSEDLVAHHHERPVIYCLMELARTGAKFGLEPPSLISMEKEIDALSPPKSPPPPPPPPVVLVEKKPPSPPAVELPPSPPPSEDGSTESEADDDDDDDLSKEQILQPEDEVSNNTDDLTSTIQAQTSDDLPENNNSENAEQSKLMDSAPIKSESHSNESGTDPNNKGTDPNELGADSDKAETNIKRPGTAPKLRRSSAGPPKSTLDQEVRRVCQKCKCQDYVNKISEGVYNVYGKRVFIRLLKGKHLMVRVGGGWDTFENYLLRHDPVQVFEFHNGETAAAHAFATNRSGFSPGAFNGYLVIRSKYKSQNFVS